MHLEKIHVSAVDNELYIIAFNESVSVELCHLKSGYNKPVDYTVYPGAILPELPEGEFYSLALVGINWGAQYTFDITLSFDGEPEKKYKVNGSPGVGYVWSETVENISVRP
ncbi:hypothetical protein [Acidithiobacillus sp.]